jgi:hypothetical protein
MKYRRYRIETKAAPDIIPLPSRFRVEVKKRRLALLLLKEALHYRGNITVVLSRPCVYGVFSGPVGGFAPRERLCVGCLRCMIEYPDVVRVRRNSEHMGDSYFTPEHFEAISYEARTGLIPVKGAGYRGRFGGEGWDCMWTDMSEIVRPTRDGIHGREFISTAVDIGAKPPFLEFDKSGRPKGQVPRLISIPIPFIIDSLPDSVASPILQEILSRAALEAETLAVMPLARAVKLSLAGRHIVPRIGPADRHLLDRLDFEPAIIELCGWDESFYVELERRFPRSIICARLEFGEDLIGPFKAGVRVFHLVANYHGRGRDRRFILELIRQAHGMFVEMGRRDEVTLLASGGIIAAEHVPKAIICGLDSIALDTPVLAALQARFLGECESADASRFQLPKRISVEWGVQRVKNLLASWRDQLLEVLGAMGLREVRRLRGEIGRAIFQKELEREAFAGIEGYGD